MKGVILLCLVLGLCAPGLISAIVYQDDEYESIVIDEDPEDSLELETPEDSTTETVIIGPSCKTSNGVPGTCLEFENCFPFASTYNSSHFDSFQLYEILQESVSPCPGHDDLICCPDFKYGLPIKKAQYEGQTTEVPSSSSASSNSTGSVAGRGSRNACGSNIYQPSKVVGGREAQPGEFPYTVALIKDGRHFCGGSLISEQWVLTAAHCIVTLKTFSGVSVHVGDHNLKLASEAKHEAHSVLKGYYNQRFSMNHLQHDVALLKLDKPVTLSKTIGLVCLSDSPPPENQKATLSGWGKTGKHRPPSNTLRTVEMRIIPHKECKAAYQNERGAPEVTTSMVCAGEGSQGSPALKDACNGDSGGPLVIFKDAGKATQIGVVSWGKGCGDKPGVYTRVDKYRDWIDKVSRRT